MALERLSAATFAALVPVVSGGQLTTGRDLSDGLVSIVDADSGEMLGAISPNDSWNVLSGDLEHLATGLPAGGGPNPVTATRRIVRALRAG